MAFSGFERVKQPWVGILRQLRELFTWDGTTLTITAPLTGEITAYLLHVRDEKASGTDGGTFNSGAWRTRTLNTVKTNEISGASLGSNQITLPAGTFYIEAWAPAHMVDRHKAKLYNATDAANIIFGSSEYTASGASYAVTSSRVCGRFTLSASKVLELQHQCSTTKLNDGLGVKASTGGVEVYAEVMIWKVA